MHPASDRTVSRIAIGLVAVLLLVGGLSMAALGSHPSTQKAASLAPIHPGTLARSPGGISSGVATPHAAPAARVVPAAVNTTNIALSVSTIPNRYNPVPLEMNFTLGVQVNTTWWNSSLSSATTTLSFSIQNAVTAVIQSTVNIPVVTGQTAYSVWIDDTNLSCPSIDPTCQSITDPYFVTVTATVNLTASPYDATTATASSGLSTPDGFLSFAFITVPVSLTPLSPLSSTVPLGNLTFSATYTGQYVFIANLTVFSSTQAGLPIFYSSMLKSTEGNPVSALWLPASTGAYPISFALVTIYGLTIYKNSTLTVQSIGGGHVYTNTTTWHNGTGVLGLSAAVGGTTLLLVGLIVGMIVAFLLGRAVTSRAPAAPAQAWSGTSTAPAGANTCSTCGKAFDTPEELAAHAKSEHGM
jgi:hypothetical protein